MLPWLSKLSKPVGLATLCLTLRIECEYIASTNIFHSLPIGGLIELSDLFLQVVLTMVPEFPDASVGPPNSPVEPDSSKLSGCEGIGVCGASEVCCVHMEVTKYEISL